MPNGIAIRKLLPPAKPRGRKREIGWRTILNGIFYVNHEGCPWRALPKYFGKWQSFYPYFRLWRIDGTWQRGDARSGRLQLSGANRCPAPDPKERIMSSIAERSSGGIVPQKEVK